MCYVTARSGQKPSEKGKRNRVTSPAVDYELPDELEGRLCLKDGMWGNRKQPITMCEDSREENCRETLLRINMARIAPSGSSHTQKKIVLECAQCLKALREVLSHVERFGVFSLGVILGKTENLHVCKKWERLTETAVNLSLEKHPPLSPSVVCCVCVEHLWKQGSKKKLLWNKWLKRCWRDQFGLSYSCSFITTVWFSHWSAPMSVFCGSVSRFDANSVFSTWLK